MWEWDQEMSQAALKLAFHSTMAVKPQKHTHKMYNYTSVTHSIRV